MSRKLRTVTTSSLIASGVKTGSSAGTTDVGYIKQIFISAPDLDDATYTVTVTGPTTGMTLFSKAGLAKNAISNITADANNMLLNIPLPAGSTVTVSEATNASTDRTFTIKLLMDVG